jgi:hypothetical protein
MIDLTRLMTAWKNDLILNGAVLSEWHHFSLSQPCEIWGYKNGEECHVPVRYFIYICPSWPTFRRNILLLPSVSKGMPNKCGAPRPCWRWESVRSSKTSIHFYQTILRHIPEESALSLSLSLFSMSTDCRQVWGSGSRYLWQNVPRVHLASYVGSSGGSFARG